MKKISVFVLLLGLSAPLWAGTHPQDMYKQLKRAIIQQARQARAYEKATQTERTQAPHVFFDKTFLGALTDFQKNASHHVLDDQHVIVGFDNLYQSYKAMRAGTTPPLLMQEYVGQLDTTLNTGKTHQTVAHYIQQVLDSRANKGPAYRRHYQSPSADREVYAQEASLFKSEVAAYKQNKSFINALSDARATMAAIKASQMVPHTTYSRGQGGEITSVTRKQEVGPVKLIQVEKPVEQLTDQDKIVIKSILRKLLPLVREIYPMFESAQQRHEVATYLMQFPLQTSDGYQLDVAKFLATYGPVYDDKEDFEQEEELGNFLQEFGVILLQDRTDSK